MSGRRVSNSRRLALANTASGVGAGLLGICAGLLFHDELLAYFPGLLVIGFALHTLGMLDKRRIDKQEGAKLSWWMRTLYSVCWVGLAALAAYAVSKGFKP